MTNRLPTNFFARQKQTRSNCRKLVILFILALLCIITAIYFAFRLVCYINLITSVLPTSGNYTKNNFFLWWEPTTFILVFITVTIFITIAGLIKMRQLQQGGDKVAEMLGGRLVAKNTNTPAERQLLNIVEEMSIAAGIPVPLVYILEKENGINAFAAGLNINDAVIAVTHGALNSFTRDELQGVIAHEFSHILYGDMRLNIQLIGIIYGILVLGIIGGEILENRRISATSAVLFIGGVLLAAIGYIGTFAGRIIQSCVSRQKEFLADASAVKFTRNPAGLAAALKKIGGYVSGSRINSPTARQASHLFFGETHSDILFPEFLATHPPLIERILLLDPFFDGKFPLVNKSGNIFCPAHNEVVISAVDNSDPNTRNPLMATAKPADIINQVGNPTSQNLNQGNSVLSSIPQHIKDMLNTSQGAAAVIYSLLITNKCSQTELTFNSMAPPSLAIPGAKDDFLQLCDLTSNIKADEKLPLVELALPSLHGLTVAEKNYFLATIDSLIRDDGEITLFEFSVQWIVQQYLVRGKEKIFGDTSFSQITQIGYHILIILRSLANAGNRDNAEAARSAFYTGVARIPELASKNPDYHYAKNINFAEINTALKKLACSSFNIRQIIVDACAHCALADKTVSIEEIELLRILSLALHCPLPPFVPDRS